MAGNLESLRAFLPESALSIFILLIIILNFFRKTGEEKVFLNYLIGIVVLIICLILELLSVNRSSASPLFLGMYTNDGFSHVFKLFFLLSSIFFLFFSFISGETGKKLTHSAEYLVLIFSTTLGMMLMAGASNLLMLYLAMEFLGLASYLLTGFLDNKARYTEAAIKYLLYGGVASGVMIYGLSILYGLTGSLDYSAIAAAIKVNNVSPLLLYISLILVFAGFGFKIAAFPFHAWCPDVYEGAPTPLTAFLSVGSKAAGFAILIRFFIKIFSVNLSGDVLQVAGNVEWPFLIAVFSAFTMTFGNLAALHQENVKRLLAYSSIAHAGYMLMALASATQTGISYIFLYLAFYFLMNFGAFLVVIIISNQLGTESIADYEGLAWKNGYGAFLATVFSLFLFSLTGLPPFAGFIGKFYLFLPLFAQGSKLMWLAFIGIANSVISLYYYMRIVRNMFLRKPASEVAITKPSVFEYALLLGFSFFTLLFGLYWTPVMNVCKLTLSLF